VLSNGAPKIAGNYRSLRELRVLRAFVSLDESVIWILRWFLVLNCAILLLMFHGFCVSILMCCYLWRWVASIIQNNRVIHFFG
jgi:hypothetical protein